MKKKSNEYQYCITEGERHLYWCKKSLLTEYKMMALMICVLVNISVTSFFGYFAGVSISVFSAILLIGTAVSYAAARSSVYSIWKDECFNIDRIARGPVY